MRKTLTFLIAAALPLTGRCASVYWDAGSISPFGYGDWEETAGYFWTLELGDWEGGMELGYMSFGFFVEERGSSLLLTPGLIDVAAEKWAKRYTRRKPEITEASVKENAFITNTGSGGATTPTYTVSKDGEITFGYATRSYVDDDEWIFGWVTFVFENGVPYASSGCYVYGADGIYAGSSDYIPRQIPEPSAAALFAIGIVTLSLRRGQRVA